MTRLALPVILTVVFAFSPIGYADCHHPNPGACSCAPVQPVGGVPAEFPGHCNECAHQYEHSLWADYCATKRVRVRHTPSGGNCRPRHHVGIPVFAWPCKKSRTSTCADGCHDIQKGQAIVVDDNHPIHADTPATPIESLPSPPKGSYFGAPSSEPAQPASPAETPADAAETQVESTNPPADRTADEPIAEIDQQSAPDAALDSASEPPAPPRPPMPIADESEEIEKIEKSVDEAVDKALNSEEGANQDSSDAADGRSAVQRKSWLKIFGPRNR